MEPGGYGPRALLSIAKSGTPSSYLLVGEEVIVSGSTSRRSTNTEGPMRFSKMIQAVDTHACGEPGRVIVGGVLDVPGSTMFEKMLHLRDQADGLRKLMLREPRGYPAANCNLILPPTRPEAAAGYVIMEQVEYPGMSGTNTIAGR